STTWSKLSAADRDAWGWVTGGTRAGYVQYLRSWLVQIGAKAIEEPPPPIHINRPGPLHPVTDVDEDDLMLVGLSRELTQDEEMICRVYDQVPRTWAKVRLKTHRYEPVAWREGLGVTPNRVQFADPAERGHGIYTGVTMWDATWTMEMWIRPEIDQVIDPACLWSQSENTCTLYWNAFGTIRLYISGELTTLGPALPGGQWYYVVLRADEYLRAVDLWINGKSYRGWTTGTPGGMVGTQTIGVRQDDHKYQFVGRLGPVHISNTLRDEAWIVDHWNGGKGRPYICDGWTVTLLNMDEQTGDVLHDSSAGGTDWIRVDLGTAYGPWCRTLYAHAERVMPEGRVNIESRVKDLTRLAGLPWLDRVDY
ncbi:unnamed protein product, partial [marine sediment metagenome]